MFSVYFTQNTQVPYRVYSSLKTYVDHLCQKHVLCRKGVDYQECILSLSNWKKLHNQKYFFSVIQLQMYAFIKSTSLKKLFFGAQPSQLKDASAAMIA